MVIEIILNNKNQIYIFSNEFTFLKGKKMFVYIIGKNSIENFNLVIWNFL